MVPVQVIATDADVDIFDVQKFSVVAVEQFKL